VQGHPPHALPWPATAPFRGAHGGAEALDDLLKELDAAKKEAGYWSIFNISQLIERMRRLLRGGSEG
jgi:hypothetical protein